MDNPVDPKAYEPGLQADQRLVDRGWLRIGAGAAVAAQAMVFSLSVNLSEIEGWAYAVVHGILIFSALGSLVFIGGDLVRSALESLRERKIGIDLLFLVTLLGAFAGSLVSTFTRAGSVYYEVVAILIVVHTVGKMLGARSRVAALRAVDDTREKFEWCDVMQFDGSVVRSRVQALVNGARVRVAPGGAISVDGEIISGRGYVQETSMTGEWRPEPRGSGDRVLAGTFSIDGSFEIRALGGARKLDAILEVVSRARLAPSRLQQQADRLMAWFLPLVVGVCVATFLWWYLHGPWARALFNAMAVLLVACPCAMGLATPVAVWGGLARLTKLGLVARTGDFLDVLSRTDTVCIDKTGTLSTDTLSAKAWKIEPAFRERETWLKAAVAVVEEGLSHPIAEALRGETDIAGMQISERKIEPGRGVVATVRDAAGPAIKVAIGEAELRGGNVPSTLNGGKSVYVFIEDQLAATIEFEERWRAGLSETFAALRELDLAIEVLSGDPQAAGVLGDAVVVRAGLTPAQKLSRIEELQSAGRTVLFVGDGINDAAAMSAAHGSIAMRGGADLARASSMAVFVGDDLRFLSLAIGFARVARRSIRINLLFAAAYNLAGMALAAAGVLHPVAAALLMLGSSVFVSVNALRAGREPAQAR
jgi:heavy metal translocating P-type ATPase